MTLCIWDLQSGQAMCTPLKGPEDQIVLVGVSADSSHIFSVSADRMIHIWGRQSGELEYTIGPIETDGQYTLVYQERWPAAFLFDGRRAICGSESGRIYVWQNGKQYFSLTGHKSEVTSIAFSPDGQSFVSGSNDGDIIIWEARSGEKLFDPFKGHSDRVYSTVFSPDGSLIASSSRDETILIWSTHKGSQVGNPLQGHTDGVRSVAFSPNGKRLVSGSHDTNLRIWDVISGESIAVFEGHTHIVLSVAFSPDGTRIASGSSDMTVRLWNAPPPEGPSSQRHGGNEAFPGAANDAKDDMAVDWEMDKDGWVRDTQHRLLLWVPPDLRGVLLRQHNSCLISRQGQVELDFSDARIGDNWETCYKAL
ncbi:hypothetical protein RSAG8_03733, partial [Rhizoctonia solani AG-8 WAC10335]